jgi:hypothetical protein
MLRFGGWELFVRRGASSFIKSFELKSVKGLPPDLRDGANGGVELLFLRIGSTDSLRRGGSDEDRKEIDPLADAVSPSVDRELRARCGL